MLADAQPFDFPGTSDGGVLLLHGFTGTPFEMRFLGRALQTRGYTVLGPLLPGHGSTVEALDATTWRDWLGGAEAALAELRGRCGRVALVGMSMGGLLALHLARNRPSDIAVIASLAAPLWLPAYITIPLRGLTRLRVGVIPKLGGPDVRDPEMKRRNPSLPAFPLHALSSLVELMALVRAEIDAIRVPAFVAHARRDHTAPPGSGRELARRLRDVRYLPLDRSYHIVTIDVERDLLVDELAKFLAERMA